MKVPNGWEVKQIKSLGNVVSGGTPNTDILKYWNGSINWATPTDITKLQDIYIRETERKISKEGLQNSSAKILPKGSLLVCTRATIGYMAITVNETSTNQGFKNLIPNDKNLVEFLYYILTYERYKLISKANGSTFIEVSKKDFENIKLLIPPLPEQRKIAKILGCWDRAIAACEQLIATSKQQKQALMQQLLTAKKRFGEFTGEWEKIKLKDIANYRRGSFPQPYGNPEWVDNINGYPFIQVFDIDKNMQLKKLTKIKISNQAINKSVFIRKGTVIVSLQGSIGRVAITQYDAYVDRTILLFQDYKQNMNSLYFAYAIQELFLIEKEKAPGGTIKTITKEVLSSFTIKIPTLAEQQKIAQVLTAADSEIEILQQKLAKLQQEKQALMQQLLTGKRWVKVDENYKE